MDVIIKRRLCEEGDELAENLHPVLKRIYRARGACTQTDVERELSALIPFHDLKNIQPAAELLADAVMNQQRILIVGDYDADGATSTALAVRALKLMHAQHVYFIVPNRFEYGYGLTPEIVALAALQKPDVLITVDNGIASLAGVDAARALNMCVIVTDHHLAGAQLPDAHAIVNSNQPDDIFPSKCLAGVGTIFYVMLALRQALKAREWFAHRAEPMMASLLDLVALGTVADVVPLDKNNRILVHQGLKRIQAGKCSKGLLALLAVAKRDPATVVAADLGFAVAPRLNAAGRLEEMSLGVELLLTEDETVAKRIALELNELNQTRRELEADMQQQARESLARLQVSEKSLPTGVCLYDPDWHQGVIGLVASRMKDQYHRPVIAFARAGENELKGSARSIPGFHMRDALDAIATMHPGLLTKFGGHAMAAGLSLLPEHYEQFKQLFADYVALQLSQDHLKQVLYSDGELTTLDISLPLAQCLREAGPWGQAFPEPLFDGEFILLDQRLVAEKHLKCTLGKDGAVFEAIAFNVNLQVWPNHHCRRVHVVYKLDINTYQGRKTVQLLIENLRSVE